MSLAVRTVGLTKRFGAIEALRGISFEAYEGEIFGLIGPNGAGKTTAFRILATLILPTLGSAYVYGLDVVKEAAKVREIISYLPEEVGAYRNLTGREYLNYISRVYFKGREAEETFEIGLKISGLSDEDLSRLMKTYSRGMKRRIQLARALMVRPKLAILDEPPSGLDPVQKSEIRGVIKKYARGLGVTALISTHEMYEAEAVCDRVAIIDRGVIIANGTVKEVIEDVEARNLEDAFLKYVKMKRIMT